MLDVMRKHSRSFIIYVLFGIIISVFIINFGPQSAGCTATTTHASKVDGKVISGQLFQYAWLVWKQSFQFATRMPIDNLPEAQITRFRGMAMDQLIMRELLADDAMKLGIRIPEKEINDMLIKGRFLALGRPQPLIRGDDGKFDYELFSRYIKNVWGITVKKFKEEQRRELLALKVRQLLGSSVKASEQEVKSDFAYKNKKVELSYVQFSPADVRSEIRLAPQMIKRYLSAHKDKVKAYYEENKSAYSKLPKQVKLLAIQVGVDPQTDAEKEKAKAAAKRKAEAVYQRLKSGEDFAKVAFELSAAAPNHSADWFLGWRNEDSIGLDEAAQAAVTTLKEGEFSSVIKGKETFVILKLLKRRQGDLSLEQAQDDIAEELLRGEESLKLALETAQTYLKRAKAGEKLSALFISDGDSNAEDQKTDSSSTSPNPQSGATDRQQTAKQTEKPQPPERDPRFKLASTILFSRNAQGRIPGIGISKELNSAIFSLKTGDMVPKPFVINDIVYLVAIKDRKDPDWKEWKKNKADLIESYASTKAQSLIQNYMYNRCETALKEDRISVNRSFMVTPGYQPPKGEPPVPAYVPCFSLQPMS